MKIINRVRGRARFVVFVISILVLTVLPLSALTTDAQSTPTGVGAWSEQTDYGASSGSSGSGGIPITAVSCVTYSGYVYCVGGVSFATFADISNVYYAKVSSSGSIGAWTGTTNYGATSGTSGSGGIDVATSCVEYNGYIYCVGGATNSATSQPSYLSDVFYAQLSSSGVGPWTETTDYGATTGTSGSGGVKITGLSCVTDGSYVYCVGGGTSKVFYAQLSSSGVGAWTETTDYGATSGSSGSGGETLISGMPCVSSGGYIYCVGGLNNAILSRVFFAPLSSSGVGAWSETTDYGATSGSSGSGGVPVYLTGCAAYSDAIICVGGETGVFGSAVSSADVFYAQVSSNGIGAWNQTTSYGDEILPAYHVTVTTSGTDLIGIGGGISVVLTSPIEPVSGSTSSTSTSTISTTTSTTTKSTTTSTACSYTATMTGNWNDPSVWSPSPVAPFPTTVPGGCAVVISAGIQLTVPAGVSVVNQGTIQNSGTVLNSGTLNNNVGSITNAGLLIDAVGSSFVNSASLSNTGTISNSGSITNSGTMTISSGGVITNTAGGSISNSGTVTNNAGTTFTNSGTLNNQGGGLITNFGTMTDNGMMTNQPSSILVNNGGLTVSQGATFTNSGAFSNNSGGTFTTDAGFDNALGGQFSNSGTVVVNDGVFTNEGTYDNHGVTGGPPSESNPGPTTKLGGGQLTNTGVFTNGGSLLSDADGVIVNGAGGVLDNAGYFDNNGSVTNQGEFENSGTISGTGTISGNAIVEQAATTSSTVPEFPGQILTLTLIIAFLMSALLTGRNSRESRKAGSSRSQGR